MELGFADVVDIGKKKRPSHPKAQKHAHAFYFIVMLDIRAAWRDALILMAMVQEKKEKKGGDATL